MKHPNPQVLETGRILIQINTEKSWITYIVTAQNNQDNEKILKGARGKGDTSPKGTNLSDDSHHTSNTEHRRQSVKSSHTERKVKLRARDGAARKTAFFKKWGKLRTSLGKLKLKGFPTYRISLVKFRKAVVMELADQSSWED